MYTTTGSLKVSRLPKCGNCNTARYDKDDAIFIVNTGCITAFCRRQCFLEFCKITTERTKLRNHLSKEDYLNRLGYQS